MTPAQAKRVKLLALQVACAYANVTAARGRHWTVRRKRIQRREEMRKRLLDYLDTLTETTP